jgi:quercetin dioxygenase-like cupin family protein
MKNLVISMVLINITIANAQSEPVKGGVYKWNELPVVKTEDRESRKILEGVSPHFEYLEIHATTQLPGAKASTAHANEDIEECILVVEGKMKVAFENESTILEAGGVLLLMPKQMHSLQNVGDTNLTYYVMRYKSKKPMNIERGQANGGSLLLNVDDLVYKNTELGGATDYFNRPTSMCEKFEMHSTVLNIKGPSHTPHAHLEGEIFLVVSGNTEMTIDGKEYKGGAGDLFFIKSQLMHGMRNATDNPCKYFVFKWN